MKKYHTFHIPVMGTAFTADTPLKVAKYGIDSVISIVDDVLLERLRKVYSKQYCLPYQEIKKTSKNYRSDRITSYLNLINTLSKEKFNKLINVTKDKFQEVKKYFAMLPDDIKIKHEFDRLTSGIFSFNDLSVWLKKNLVMGSIDVNIMTKVDKTNYFNNKELPSEYNDAHASLRGFANSDLASSIIFSAGMNPRLYGYIAQFEDFYPDQNGYIKKKIVLKVSDFRSAIIQGKFLAKKGLWVSEYRIESGLNCGGHAFATDGFLMGPILSEFKSKRVSLIAETFDILTKSLETNNRVLPKETLPIRITAQGGVGTAKEQQFLLDYYNLDSIGWGTPFLLVPEVTTVDNKTRKQLIKAKEKDLYLSNESPLGVPFNILRNNSKDLERKKNIKKGNPGSPCPRGFLALSNEYNAQGICTASKQFQQNKINESHNDKSILVEKIVEKTCLCMGLAASAVVNHDIQTRESLGVSICPGPNMAYFDKSVSLLEMIRHIYGFENICRTDKPNMFLKELYLYLDYLKDKVKEAKSDWNIKQERYFNRFFENMNAGIDYYTILFGEIEKKYHQSTSKIITEIENAKNKLDLLISEIEDLRFAPIV